jgi:hypothetical protein
MAFAIISNNYGVFSKENERAIELNDVRNEAKNNEQNKNLEVKL